jgi:hypothetical protein
MVTADAVVSEGGESFVSIRFVPITCTVLPFLVPILVDKDREKDSDNDLSDIAQDNTFLLYLPSLLTAAYDQQCQGGPFISLFLKHQHITRRQLAAYRRPLARQQILSTRQPRQNSLRVAVIDKKHAIHALPSRDFAQELRAGAASTRTG